MQGDFFIKPLQNNMLHNLLFCWADQWFEMFADEHSQSPMDVSQGWVNRLKKLSFNSTTGILPGRYGGRAGFCCRTEKKCFFYVRAVFKPCLC